MSLVHLCVVSVLLALLTECRQALRLHCTARVHGVVWCAVVAIVSQCKGSCDRHAPPSLAVLGSSGIFASGLATAVVMVGHSAGALGHTASRLRLFVRGEELWDDGQSVLQRVMAAAVGVIMSTQLPA
jgi:hypothetical protein